LPPGRAAGRELGYVVLDLDVTLIEVHSEKEQASAHFSGGFRYHPLLCFFDNTHEALAGILRTGRAGSNTAADHITVLDLALGQLPEAAGAGRILVRTDGAGFSHQFLDLVAQGLEHSVGYAVTEDVRDAITLLPQWAWVSAVDADGGLRDGAQIAEISEILPEVHRLAAARHRRERAAKAQAAGQKGPLDPPVHGSWPTGMRVRVRRERPHPGAQLDAFEDRDGWRYQAMATNTGRRAAGVHAARHRAHARVEDRIRQAQDAGLGRLPSRVFAINAVWLELALVAADLLAWTQTILLTDAAELARRSGTRSATGCCTPLLASPLRPTCLAASAEGLAWALARRWPWPTRSCAASPSRPPEPCPARPRRSSPATQPDPHRRRRPPRRPHAHAPAIRVRYKPARKPSQRPS
jgi:hypothetical protein